MKKTKKKLTIDYIKRKQNKERKIFYIPIGFGVFMFVPGIYAFLIALTSDNIKEELFLLIPMSAFVIIPLIIIVYFYKQLKKANNINNIIQNGSFKIVEDMIYDKDYSVSKDSEGRNRYYYSIFSKIYGELTVNSEIYYSSNKDDLIYLVIFNDQGIEKKYTLGKDEEEINGNIVAQIYNGSMWELDYELKSFLIKYDVALGDINFSNRINYLIQQEKELRKIYTCKNCNKEFEIEEYRVCPGCGSEYKYDIKDVINHTEWY